MSLFEWENTLQHLIRWAIKHIIWICKHDTCISFYECYHITKKREVFTCSRKRIVNNQHSVRLLRNRFYRNNDDLGWWCCLVKEGVENERCGFANKKSQIERLNYQVWNKNTLHVSSVNITSWSLLERESWWTVSQNIQTPYDELLLKLCFDTMVH